MTTGLLWFDDDPGRTLEEKVRRAVARYCQKYGHASDTCYVHPTAVQGDVTVDGIAVEGRANTLVHHFYVVREGDSDGR